MFFVVAQVANCNEKNKNRPVSKHQEHRDIEGGCLLFPGPTTGWVGGTHKTSSLWLLKGPGSLGAWRRGKHLCGAQKGK